MENKISLIIPIYNVEKYLRECLDSVVNQTFKDIEIICVDDCGTDNSMQIVDEYAKKDERIKIIHHETNKGLAISRNTGMDNATGEYIFFLDSDDYILPNTLEKMYEKIISTKSDIVVSKSKAFADGNIESLKKRVQEFNDWIDAFKLKSCYVTEERFISNVDKIPCMAWGKLYKREFLFKNHLKFIEKNAIQEDEGFHLKVCSCFPYITFIQDVGVMYRIREQSIMSTKEVKEVKDFKLNIEDSFEYIKIYRKKYAKKLIKAIKNIDKYGDVLGSFRYKKALEKLFSIKNTEDRKHKQITILGIKIKIKRKKVCTNTNV